MRRSASNLLPLILLAGTTLAMPQLCRAQQTESQQMKLLPQAELDVVKVVMAQERAWNAGDMNSFLDTYKHSPDLLFVSGEVMHGFDAVSNIYRHNYPDRASMGTLSFSNIEPHILDERFATLTGKFALERPKNKGGNASGIFSLVLEKTPDGWKIILDHTTS